MIDGEALTFFKNKLIRLLNSYAGLEPSVRTLVTDFQVAVRPDARPEDIRQAIASLEGDGALARRADKFRGEVVRITPAGHAAAAALELDEP